MAKDGTNRGGARIGAGAKKKPLADKIAEVRHIGVGRGAACVIMISGLLLAVMAVSIPFFRSVKELERGTVNDKTTDNK